MVKNCDQGLENAALSLRRDVYQHTDIYQHTDHPAGNNNIYIYICIFILWSKLPQEMYSFKCKL